jgi:hypothetical protein
MHEVAMTANRAEVYESFWPDMAQSVDTVKLLAPTLQYAVLAERVGTDVTAAFPSDAAIQNFSDWIDVASGGCAKCFPNGNGLPLLGMDVTDFDALRQAGKSEEASKLLHQARSKFFEDVGLWLSKKSIHPLEIDIFIPNWQNERPRDGKNHWLCLRGSMFAYALRKIRHERQIISLMRSRDRRLKFY